MWRMFATPAVPLALVLLANALAAQTADSAPSPEALLSKKLASPFLTKSPWTLDWDAARARAKREGKLIFGYFTTAGH